MGHEAGVLGSGSPHVAVLSAFWALSGEHEAQDRFADRLISPPPRCPTNALSSDCILGGSVCSLDMGGGLHRVVWKETVSGCCRFFGGRGGPLSNVGHRGMTGGGRWKECEVGDDLPLPSSRRRSPFNRLLLPYNRRPIPSNCPRLRVTAVFSLLNAAFCTFRRRSVAGTGNSWGGA